MNETIYNIPGSQGESMDSDCCNNEVGHPQMEEKFVNAVTHNVVEALDIGYNDRRIVTPLLKKQLDEKLNSRWKQEGLLQQYEAYVLELAGERLREELKIPDEIKINHSHATHAKFADWAYYLQSKDKEAWLIKYKKDKKTG